nr:seroin 3 [Ephestia kuehniella]
MTKFAVVLLLAAFVCASNVQVYAENENLLQNEFPEFTGPSTEKSLSEAEQNILNLKPTDNNTKVEGESHSYSSHVETKDGQVVSKGSDQKDIVNDNGKVKQSETKN